MTLTLRKATLADAAEMADIYFSAFEIDVISLLCFPRNNSKVYNWWYDMIVDEIADPCSHSLVVTTPANSSSRDEIIAWSKWNAPSPKHLDTDLPKWPEGADVEVADHFFGNLFTRRKRIMGEKKHWYLEMLATKPNWQGKGAAGKLMRWGLEKADADGLETYIEASPNGKPIYEHFGFREIERLIVDLEGKDNDLGEKEFVEVLMLRPVKSSL
jgi:GNAT superfamily N-acetyltransferase